MRFTSIHEESGIALLLTLFALALISILGLIVTMNAITELRISDNSESHTQAVLAAISGIDHARIAVHRLDFDALLRGPDGVYDTSAAYITKAKSFGFRLPFSILTAQTLNIEAPLADIVDAQDDGIISTGAFFGAPGTALIPREGIAQWAYNPDGTGRILSRYFVKVTNNNGEASELAGDATNNPFIDGDGIIIVRSIGVSRTIAESAGESIRRNSVAVFESRLRRPAIWDLGPALNILGPSANAMFTGTPEIYGETEAGIGVLNTAGGGGGEFAEHLIKIASGVENISGGGLPSPSIRDISTEAMNERDKSIFFNANAMNDYIGLRAPRIADIVYAGNQNWTKSTMPFLGFYDKTRPWNDPPQKPYIVLVKGNLTVPEGLSGAGVLIITGKLECAGTLDYRGLILVLGAGELSLAADGPGIAGGIVTAKLIDTGGEIMFGAPDIEIGGATRIIADKELVRMALRLFPVEQISFREITTSDP